MTPRDSEFTFGKFIIYRLACWLRALRSTIPSIFQSIRRRFLRANRDEHTKNNEGHYRIRPKVRNCIFVKLDIHRWKNVSKGWQLTNIIYRKNIWSLHFQLYVIGSLRGDGEKSSGSPYTRQKKRRKAQTQMEAYNQGGVWLLEGGN